MCFSGWFAGWPIARNIQLHIKRGVPMERLVFAAAGIFAAVALACGAGKELTRSKAKEILLAKLQKEAPQVEPHQMGILAVGNAQTVEQVLVNSNPYFRYLKQLMDAGVINVKWAGRRRWSDSGATVGLIDVSLTDAGLAYKTGDFQKDWPLLKMCSREFDQITGITTQTENLALVEYTWKFTNLTPFAKYRNAIPYQPVCDPSAVNADKVFMRLYDDGWRLVD
jgi:hypothetical protein